MSHRGGLPHPSGRGGNWVDEGSSDGQFDDNRSWGLYKDFESYVYSAFRGDRVNSGVRVGKMKEVARGIYVEIIGWTKDNDAFRDIIKAFPGTDGISVDAEDDDTARTMVRAHLPWPEKKQVQFQPRSFSRGEKGWKLIDQPIVIISALVGVSLLASLTTEGSQWIPIARLVGVM